MFPSRIRWTAVALIATFVIFILACGGGGNKPSAATSNAPAAVQAAQSQTTQQVACPKLAMANIVKSVSSPQMYVFGNGGKLYPIPDPETLVADFPDDPRVEMSDACIAALPKGDPVPSVRNDKPTAPTQQVITKQGDQPNCMVNAAPRAGQWKPVEDGWLTYYVQIIDVCITERIPDKGGTVLQARPGMVFVTCIFAVTVPPDIQGERSSVTKFGYSNVDASNGGRIRYDMRSGAVPDQPYFDNNTYEGDSVVVRKGQTRYYPITIEVPQSANKIHLKVRDLKEQYLTVSLTSAPKPTLILPSTPR